ncbi:magnesium transporter [Stieleria varia]|uniref:Magnesium transporter MgtE n=1 Tax=Stieleria varia TaxID=2528005 RepID=A0A5C6B3C3_9BACT|nr:magnesium transporter [Stieleria varia]TWU06400.1 Magnesium transporter MgtE [Stieleria varia]
MSETQSDELPQLATQDEERPWLTMARLAEEGDSDALVAYVESLSTADQALALSRLDTEQMPQVFETLHPDEAAELLSHLSEAQAAQTIGLLDPSSAAAIIHELPSDEQADVLGDLDEDQANAILDALPATEAAAVRELTAYKDDVAGGLMVSELLRFNEKLTVGQMIEQLAGDLERDREMDVRYGYVCDDQNRLVGVLPMQNLLFVKRASRIADIMIRNPLSVRDTTPLEDLVEFFETHAFLGVPVVNSDGGLMGIVQRKAVDYEAFRAAESDYLKSQGIVGGEELRTMPLLLRSRRRLSWLSINIVLNLGAASVIALFQDTLQSVIALAVFLPIISDMSGCSGNQAVAISMRELSLGLVRPSEFLRVWWQEVSLGLVNGTVLGLLVAICAIVFDGNPYLGLVVGLALMLNTLIAVSIGGTIPLLLKKLKVDPAVASGPLLTTVTDMCGFFLVLSLATLMLSKLV